MSCCPVHHIIELHYCSTLPYKRRHPSATKHFKCTKWYFNWKMCVIYTCYYTWHIISGLEVLPGDDSVTRIFWCICIPWLSPALTLDIPAKYIQLLVEHNSSLQQLLDSCQLPCIPNCLYDLRSLVWLSDQTYVLHACTVKSAANLACP